MRLALLSLLIFSTMLNAATWLTNYDTALARAEVEHKVVLVDFTGSDWCPWCIKLEKEVFETPEFNTWATTHAILLKIDFPHSIPQDNATRGANEALSQRYKVRAFPTIVLLTPDGKEKARTGYRRGGVAPYIEHLNGLLK